MVAGDAGGFSGQGNAIAELTALNHNEEVTATGGRRARNTQRLASYDKVGLCYRKLRL